MHSSKPAPETEDGCGEIQGAWDVGGAKECPEPAPDGEILLIPRQGGGWWREIGLRF